MSETNPSLKQLTEMINNIMGMNVLSEQQVKKIMDGAKKANDRGGLPAVLEYLMKVTQADVEMDDIKEFANNIKKNPQSGLDILKGKN